MNSKTNIPDPDLELKQLRFNAAMERYETKWIYQFIGNAVSFINVSLQILLLWMVLQRAIGPLLQLFSLAAAFLTADFVNGLVHMYMDNSERYEGFAGPLYASFHLHHRTPQYKRNNLLHVYYFETGSKIWLIPCLAASVLLIGVMKIEPVAAYFLFYFGILSSVAEVTHYRCHVPDSRLAGRFGGYGVLLSKRHHARHHVEDNVNYAFLCGITDPLLNVIAAKIFPGYKHTTDRHYERYTGKGTSNR